MEKALKEKWLEALRSGQYKQTIGVLKMQSENGDCRYCCLGVLCDVSGEGEWVEGEWIEGEWIESPLPDAWFCEFGYTFVDATMTGALSPEFRKRHGIPLKTRDLLIGMNDNKGMSFKEIADWIETNIKEEA
jgi:hypothetical protein